VTHRPFLDRLARLRGDNRGATIVEFAIVVPSFLLLLFGIFDVGQAIYAQSVLQGAMQDAGRDAGLESGTDQAATIDAYVRKQTAPIVFGDPEYTVKRSNYKTFSDVGRPEDFTDSNNNNYWDPNECFTDENGNNDWDPDVGKDGIGGANDVALYTVTVAYDRVFPLWKMLGQNPKTTLSASTTLRNQPYGQQAARAKTQVCPT